MCLLGAWIHLGQKKWNRGSGVQAAYFLGCSTNSDCASLSCSIGKEVLSVPSSWSYERANFQRLWNVLIRQAQDPPAETPLGFCCLCQKRKKLPCGTPGFEKSALQMSRFKRLEACYPSRCDGRKRTVCCGVLYGSLLLSHLPSLRMFGLSWRLKYRTASRKHVGCYMASWKLSTPILVSGSGFQIF